MPHIHEKIDFTAEALVVHKNKVLLRKHDKYDLWLGIGGHVELDEDPNEAVIREAKEEAGLTVKLVGKTVSLKNAPDEKDLVPPRFLNRHRINPTHEHVDMIYFATTDTDKVIEGDGEAAKGFHWFTKKELADPKWQIKESIRHYAQKALEEVGK